MQPRMCATLTALNIERFHHPRKRPGARRHPLPQPRATTGLPVSVEFSGRFTSVESYSLCSLVSDFFHVGGCVRAVRDGAASTAWTHHALPICWPAADFRVCVCFRAAVNGAAVHTRVPVWTYVSFLSGRLSLFQGQANRGPPLGWPPPTRPVVFRMRFSLLTQTPDVSSLRLMGGARGTAPQRGLTLFSDGQRGTCSSTRTCRQLGESPEREAGRPSFHPLSHCGEHRLRGQRRRTGAGGQQSDGETDGVPESTEQIVWGVGARSPQIN